MAGSGTGAGAGAFVVALDRGETYLFAPTSRLGEEERNLILSVADELAGRR